MGTEKTRAVIIAGGEIKDIKRLCKMITPDDFVICADKGYEYAVDGGILPDLILGDFDSLSVPLPENTEIIKLPCEKDDTDLHFAAKYAVEHKFRKVAVFGATGGRSDHTVAAAFTLRFLHKNGIDANLFTNSGEMFFIENSSVTLENSGRYVSVFPFEKEARGITLEGFKYPLCNASLGFDFPLGVSNEIIDDFGTITVKNGCLLVISESKTESF